MLSAPQPNHPPYDDHSSNRDAYGNVQGDLHPLLQPTLMPQYNDYFTALLMDQNESIPCATSSYASASNYTLQYASSFDDGDNDDAFDMEQRRKPRKKGRPAKKQRCEDSMVEARVDSVRDHKFCVSDQIVSFGGNAYQVVYRRPPLSYADIITYALAQNERQKLKLSSIYSFLTSSFGYFKYSIRTAWENSVRHNLSIKSKTRFQKEEKQGHEAEKGCFWSFNQAEPHYSETLASVWEATEALHSFRGVLFYRLAPGQTPVSSLLCSDDNADFVSKLWICDTALGSLVPFSLLPQDICYRIPIPAGYIRGRFPIPPPPYKNLIVKLDEEVGNQLVIQRPPSVSESAPWTRTPIPPSKPNSSRTALSETQDRLSSKSEIFSSGRQTVLGGLAGVMENGATEPEYGYDDYELEDENEEFYRSARWRYSGEPKALQQPVTVRDSRITGNFDWLQFVRAFNRAGSTKMYSLESSTGLETPPTDCLFTDSDDNKETVPSLLFGSPEQQQPVIIMSEIDLEQLIKDPNVVAAEYEYLLDF